MSRFLITLPATVAITGDHRHYTVEPVIPFDRISQQAPTEPKRDWFSVGAHVHRSEAFDSSIAVSARLLAMIQAGDLGPAGRMLPERELCAVIGVSRRTLRRALDALMAEGLIWRKQGKGTFAGQPPDPTGVLAAEITGETNPVEVMEARLCIEPALAALCARHALPADIERMRHLARRTIEAADPDGQELWDGALHRLIARTARNRPLLTAFSLLSEIRASASWRALRSQARSVETLRVSDRQHHAIIDAIEAGHPDRAKAAMREHLQTVGENLERIIAQAGAGTGAATGAGAQT